MYKNTGAAGAGDAGAADAGAADAAPADGTVDAEFKDKTDKK